jgi:hypothetical protein
VSLNPPLARDDKCDTGILRRVKGERRNRTFAYEAYLEILREGT